MKTRFSEPLEFVLRAAGWFPGRNVGDMVSKWKAEFEPYGPWPIFRQAEEILREFGGLTITPTDKGVDYWPEPFTINPCGATGERDRFILYENEIGKKLYPLGEISSRMAFIAIDEDGRIYHLMTFIFLQANSFDEALENWIRGKRTAMKNSN